VGENPSALRRDVEEAREQLADTVEALAFKASAPRRAAERVAVGVRAHAATTIAAVAAGCMLVVLVLRRRGEG